MKSNKSPGIDFTVTVETLKFGRNELHNAVLNVCNCILNDLGVPSQCTESITIPIPKKVSKLLMSIAAGVYNRMLLNRI